MKKFLMAALALLTSVLGVQAQGYQDYRDHNYGSPKFLALPPTPNAK